VCKNLEVLKVFLKIAHIKRVAEKIPLKPVRKYRCNTVAQDSLTPTSTPTSTPQKTKRTLLNFIYLQFKLIIMYLDGNQVITVWDNPIALDQNGDPIGRDSTFVLESRTISSSQSKWVYPLHSVTIPVWATDEPDLTVADLADSLEAMLARRESGLSSPTTLRTMRAYPTDPATQKSAVNFLKNLQQEGKAELEQLNAEIKAKADAKAIADAKAKADAEASAAFKANQNKPTV